MTINERLAAGQVPIIDKHTNKIVRWCASRKSAQRTADRYDNKYGAYRYRVPYNFELSEMATFQG